jgi:heterodisulfide reductase subunit C
MPIHEKSLIRPEDLSTHESLVIEGVNVSGDWSTFIRSRVVRDYNEELQEEIAALPGGEYIHRCWQCGSCTNSCTVNALNPDFNPRQWIYLVRMGFEAELVRDRDIIWQCVSCNKCTSACPRDVIPEGVMKALSHWLEHKGYTPKRPSTVFDEVFSEQVVRTGKIEDGRVLLGFLRRTRQSLLQNWLVEMVKRLVSKLPIAMLMQMGLAQIFHPRTKGWAPSRRAIEEFLEEKERAVEEKLGPKQPYQEPSIPSNVNAKLPAAGAVKAAAE